MLIFLNTQNHSFMKNLLIVLILACQIYILNSQNLTTARQPMRGLTRERLEKRLDAKTQRILNILNDSFFARQEIENKRPQYKNKEDFEKIWHHVINPITKETQQKLKPFGFKGEDFYKFIETKYTAFTELNIFSNEISDINSVNIFQEELIKDIGIYFPKTITIFCKIKRLFCTFCPTKQSD